MLLLDCHHNFYGSEQQIYFLNFIRLLRIHKILHPAQGIKAQNYKCEGLLVGDRAGYCCIA